MKQVSNTSTKRASAKKNTRPASAADTRIRVFALTLTMQWAVAGALAALGIVLALLYILPMQEFAGALAFPLDDAWIPLTYARNLIEHGSYSYFSDLMTSSGSTSPLYVFLLAIGQLLGGGMFFPSAIIGILSAIATAILLFLTGRKIFENDQWIAVAVAALFLLYPRVESSMVSGMSTMLYTALISGAMYAYFCRRSVAFFALIGLALWVRPDALVFLIAALVHIAYTHAFARTSGPTMDAETARQSRASTKTGAAIFLALATLYVVFNMSLSGSIFPSSVGAKLRLYELAEPTFGADLLRFFTVGPNAVLFVFAIIGAILALLKIFNRESTPIVMPLAYVAGTLLAYGLIHPYLYESQRYLIPTIPFVLLLSGWGIREIFIKLFGPLPVRAVQTLGRVVLFAAFGGAMLVGLLGFTEMRAAHYAALRYNGNRTVKAAEWLQRNTSRNALIGTNLPGATGWYADREIIDFTGQTSPELIPTIGDMAGLKAALLARKADYLLTNRDGFEVVNVIPRWQSDISKPGITEVYSYIAGRTLLVPPMASRLNATAERILAQRNPDKALELLQQSFTIEPKSCRTNLLIGYAFLDKKDTASAASFIDEAIALHPDYALALELRGNIAMNQGSSAKAFYDLQAANRIEPESQSIKRAFDRATVRYQADSLRKAGWQVPVQSFTY